MPTGASVFSCLPLINNRESVGLTALEKPGETFFKKSLLPAFSLTCENRKCFSVNLIYSSSSFDRRKPSSEAFIYKRVMMPGARPITEKKQMCQTMFTVHESTWAKQSRSARATETCAESHLTETAPSLLFVFISQLSDVGLPLSCLSSVKDEPHLLSFMLHLGFIW